MPNLNLYHLGSIFAKISPSEFGNELLHNQAALVLNEEGLDPLFLVSAQLISQPEKLGNGFFNG